MHIKFKALTCLALTGIIMTGCASHDKPKRIIANPTVAVVGGTTGDQDTDIHLESIGRQADIVPASIQHPVMVSMSSPDPNDFNSYAGQSSVGVPVYGQPGMSATNYAVIGANGQVIGGSDFTFNTNSATVADQGPNKVWKINAY